MFNPLYLLMEPRISPAPNKAMSLIIPEKNEDYWNEFFLFQLFELPRETFGAFKHCYLD